MDKRGRWALSPAFDVAFSYNPEGDWTAQHQMSVNGKRQGFTLEDLQACARNASMKRGRAETILGEVTESVRKWPDFAERADIPAQTVKRLAGLHRHIG
jgi:serine/threonine-protein kinase HipA